MDTVDDGSCFKFDQGSDIWYDVQCTICAADGRNAEAVKICVECDSNLCANCLTQHEKFSAMKSHQLVDGGLKTRNTKLPLPSERCEVHSGKLIDIYCADHDVVCCNTCLTLNHRSCKDVHYVPKAASSHDCKQEAAELEQDAKELMTNLTNLKAKVDGSVADSETELNQLKGQVQKIRDNVNKHLDDVQQQLMGELIEKSKALAGSNGEVLRDVEGMIAALVKYESVQDECKNLSELFVKVKMGKKAVETGGRVLKSKLISPVRRTLYLVEDNNIETMLKQTTRLAHVQQMKTTFAFEFGEEFDVKTPNESLTPLIGGICQLSEHEILITDARNKTLKKLDRNFKVVSSLTLPAGPCSICKLADREVAMTMTNSKVQFVLVKDVEMVRTLSFQTGDRCRGITKLDEHLFVCCDGHSPAHPGHIQVFEKNGTLVRSCYKHFVRPKNILADTVTKRLYVTDDNRGLVLNSQCELLAWIGEGDIPNPHALCMLDGGSVCVSSTESGIVSVINHEGGFVQHIIKDAKNAYNVLAMHFDEDRSLLIVSLNGSECLRTFSRI